MLKEKQLPAQIHSQYTGEHTVLPVDACESSMMLSAIAPNFSNVPGRYASDESPFLHPWDPVHDVSPWHASPVNMICSRYFFVQQQNPC
jgi:hypothetical protein